MRKLNLWHNSLDLGFCSVRGICNVLVKNTVSNDEYRNHFMSTETANLMVIIS